MGEVPAKIRNSYCRKGSTTIILCPVSEIVCFPVLNFTYSHEENSLFFALDFTVLPFVHIYCN
jgi:hypothetical protein